MTRLAYPESPDAAPLIGRHLELETLHDRIKGARAGRAGLVVIRGAAGVGKSRLLTEGLTLAARLGFRVLHGRADELDRGLPYAALRDALAPALRAENNPRLSEIAARVQAVLTGITVSDPSDELGAAAGSLQDAFGAGEQLLREWADRDPLLIALDDLHAADPDTVTVVTLLARLLADTRVLLLATTRADPPDLDPELAAHIERLSRQPSVTVIELEELDRDDVRALVATRLGAQPDDDLVAGVVGLTRGNPFYTEELLRAYEDGGVLEVIDGRARVRGTVEVSLTSRSALLHRVFSLGGDVRAVVRALTAFQRLSLDRLNLVAELAGLDVRQVEVAFDVLVRARILDPLPDRGWEFAHPILRATLDEDLGPAERRRLHRAIAERLRADGAAGRNADLLELAAHISQSIEPGDAEAAAVLAQAGDLTVRTAPRSAADWYGRAVDAVRSDDLQRGPWLGKQARALFLAQRKAQAADAARLALCVLPPGTDRERAAVVLAGSLSAMGHMAEALAVTDAERPAGELPARLLAERAALLVQVDRFDEAEVAARAAERLAQDPAAHALAVSSLAQAAFAQGRVKSALAMLDAELAAVGDSQDASMLGVRIARASYLAYAGHCHDALLALAEVEAAASRIGGTAFRTSIDPAAVWALGLAGRWDEALGRVASAAEEFERSGELFLLSLLRTMEANILCERGDLAGARDVLAGISDTPSARLPAAWVLSAVDVAVGHLEEAREGLLRAIATGEEVGRVQVVPHMRERLIAIEVEVGNTSHAAEQLALLLAEAASSEATPWIRCVAARGEARVTRDATAAERARAIAEESGLAFEAATSGLLVGEFAKNASALRSAHETFRELGAEPWRRRAAAGLRELGQSVPRRKADAGPGLSPTERNLAQLVSDGLTNREIGRAMHLSPKTIEVYLSRLYTKTGCASRVELAVAVKSGTVHVG